MPVYVEKKHPVIRSTFLGPPVALAASLLTAGSSAGEGTPAPPNIVFILIDDMPWCGTPVRMAEEIAGSAMAFRRMPNVMRLAEQGMTFRNARSAAGMCAPSRCSIQTGMMTARHLFSGNGGFGPKTDGRVAYPARGEDARRPLLCPEPQGNIRFPSIGDVLRAAGYATAHFGKWHLYGGGPARHGYDASDGETDNKDGSVTDPATGRAVDTCEDPKRIFSITQRSLDFIGRQAKARKPFYLQISHYATHWHYQARPATLARYEKDPAFDAIEVERDRARARLGAAMTDDLDASIGQVLARLDELGLADTTYVIFTSDNGYQSWNAPPSPLRGGKWWLWEGGVRVPLVVRGPGIRAETRCAANVVGYDFLPTFADLAVATAHLAKEVDGASLKPLLLGGGEAGTFAERAICFHYPHNRVSPPCSAMVVGETKTMHWYEHPETLFLYDLRKDLGETTNVAGSDPDRARQMAQQMMERIKAAGGYVPRPNPDADPGLKRYDPGNLSDPGEGDDPEGGGDGKPPAPARPKKAKAP
jgi:arylsulfatase A-like enzyme